jgi:hypothetical protein
MPSGMTGAQAIIKRARSPVFLGERNEIARGILGMDSPDPYVAGRSFRLWSQPEGPEMGQLLASAPSDLRVTQSTEQHAPEAVRHPPPVAKAASKAAAGGVSAFCRRMNSRASGAPARRSIPASSHSIEIGPS